MIYVGDGLRIFWIVGVSLFRSRCPTGGLFESGKAMLQQSPLVPMQTPTPLDRDNVA